MVSVLSNLFHRLFPALKTLPQARVSLWVSNLDGSRMKELGYVKGIAFIPSLRWLPDGKRMSFIYDKALYTVPAD